MTAEIPVNRRYVFDAVWFWNVAQELTTASDLWHPPALPLTWESWSDWVEEGRKDGLFGSEPSEKGKPRGFDPDDGMDSIAGHKVALFLWGQGVTVTEVAGGSKVLVEVS